MKFDKLDGESMTPRELELLTAKQENLNVVEESPQPEVAREFKEMGDAYRKAQAENPGYLPVHTLSRSRAIARGFISPDGGETELDRLLAAAPTVEEHEIDVRKLLEMSDEERHALKLATWPSMNLSND
jgi:hypothetical protein